MRQKSTAGVMIALFAVSFAVTLFSSTGHRDKDVQTISSSLGMINLSAEEINRRTLQLAAAVRTSTK
jgi:hypothetical protein